MVISLMELEMSTHCYVNILGKTELIVFLCLYLMSISISVSVKWRDAVFSKLTKSIDLDI